MKPQRSVSTPRRRTCDQILSGLVAVMTWFTLGTSHSAADDSLIGHWPLIVDGRDVSGNERHATPHEVLFPGPGNSPAERRGARFDGRNAWLEVPNQDRQPWAASEFSVAAWIWTGNELDDLPGDIISRYDATTRRGFHLGLKTSAGVTFSQANTRQLQFGIDQDRATAWSDCGRPGQALLAFALCSYDGDLYAGTCEPGAEQTGHVYRYAGGDAWEDCGSPDQSNAVTALVEFNGALYAGTGKYRVAGSALPESQNTTLGGHVYRYAGGTKWVDCGALPDVEAVGGLVVFRGRLYASSLYRPAGFFRYERDQTWTTIEPPSQPPGAVRDVSHMRVEALGIHNGWLYASSYDGGYVFRFDGEQWENCGQLADNTQTYSFAVYDDQLYVGTWPSGRAYRMEQPHEWTDVGRLGEELEVMGMLVHNGRLIAGSLPLAEVYQYSGGQTWEKLAWLDQTPDVKYRRAWTLAEHAGGVFCSTLPSGHVHTWRAGRVAMADRSCPAGWHHVAAIRRPGEIILYLDGEAVGRQTGEDLAGYDLSLDQPLLIGRGPNARFNGRISDLRLYGRALSHDEIRHLVNQ